MIKNEITIENFEGHKLYNCMVPIDNIEFRNKLDGIYQSLKHEHTVRKLYTDDDVKNGVIYDPSYYLKEFNLFLYPTYEMHTLVEHIRELLITACEDQGINISEQKYYMHAWLNYFPAKMHMDTEYDNLYWHDHGDLENAFHGYYVVNAEPSTTHYRKNGKKMERNNINGRLLLAKTGIDHAVGKWDSEEPRITIAYNILEEYCAEYMHSQDMHCIMMPLV